MTIVLDTSVLIDVHAEKEKIKSEVLRISQDHPGPPYITFVTEFEFLFGLEKRSAATKAEAREFLQEFHVLHTGRETGPLLSRTRQQCHEVGKEIPLADLIIAVLTMQNNMVLVTRDKIFEHIPGLRAHVI